MILKKFYSPFFFILLVSFSILSCFNKRKERIEKHYLVKSLDIENKAKKAYDLADKFSEIQKYDSAFYYFNESKLQYELLKDSINVAHKLIEMATIQNMEGDYFGAEESAIDALKFLKQNDENIIYIRNANNILGITSTNLLNYKEALYYYSKVDELNDDAYSKIIIENNIAAVYNNLNEYSKAITILSELLNSKEINTNNITKARIIDNLGYAYCNINERRGLDYLEKAKNIRIEENDNYGLIASYIHFSKYFVKQNNKLTANSFAKSAYELSTKLHNIDDRLEALGLIVKLGYDKDINFYSQKFVILSDSIVKKRNQAKNQFIKIKYETLQNREQNMRLKSDISEKNLIISKAEKQKLLLFLMIVTSLFIAVIMYLKHKKEKQLTAVRNEARLQNEKQLEKYKTETRLSKKVHDELANDVFNTMTFAELKDLSDKDNKEVLLNYLDKIYKGSRNISRENSSVDTGVNYPDQLRDVIKGYKSDAVNVMSNGIDTIDWNATEPGKKIVVYRVLQELLVNMKKHSKSTIVVIRFQMNDDKIQIDYSDNGIGIAKNDLTLKNGLQNVETRIESINGTYTFESVPEKGFKVSFSFPK